MESGPAWTGTSKALTGHTGAGPGSPGKQKEAVRLFPPCLYQSYSVSETVPRLEGSLLPQPHVIRLYAAGCLLICSVLCWQVCNNGDSPCLGRVRNGEAALYKPKMIENTPHPIPKRLYKDLVGCLSSLGLKLKITFKNKEQAQCKRRLGTLTHPSLNSSKPTPEDYLATNAPRSDFLFSTDCSFRSTSVMRGNHQLSSPEGLCMKN